VNRLDLRLLRVGEIEIPDEVTFATESTLTTHATTTHSTHVAMTSTAISAMSTVWLSRNLCTRDHGETYDCCGAYSCRPEFQHRASTIVSCLVHHARDKLVDAPW
jgi:hypothetical protein